MSAPMPSLGELAQRFGLEVRGNLDLRFDGVGTLEAGRASQLGFLANPRYRGALASTRLGAVVLAVADVEHCPTAALIAKNPYAAYSRIAALFERPRSPMAGVHPTAVIDATAQIDPAASIGPLCVVGARCKIEAGAELGPGCIVGEDCCIGADCRLVARVTLVMRVTLGKRVLIHPGAVLGADGFGLAFDQGTWLKVPQLGGVVIGDDCEIGANTTIDRGALEDTVLEDDVRLDNQIQIGHNVRIGAHTAMAGCCAVAGSVRIGSHCLIAGGVGIAGHLSIDDRVTVQAMSLVSHSLRGPAEYASGIPVQESRLWRRTVARLRRLDAGARRINQSHQEDDNP
ncbi:MAG: UDP-3-O-(3-hydroxymyristoyl)glucosamine N-acyltransferase [Pseudomarimonas sp.]